MSWVERLKTGIKITTGDGQLYEPLSLVASNVKSFEFNISEFEFPEVEGTKVDRRLKKGTRYPLDFFFQGENNIDEANRFEQSSRDLRPWTILHPVFGQFIAHPLSIEFDHSGMNLTRISVTVVETITDAGPRMILDVFGTANEAVEAASETSGDVAELISPSVSDINTMSATTDDLYSQAQGLISNDVTAAEYFNLYMTAKNKISTTLNDGNFAVAEAIDAFISFPAQFDTDIKSKLQIFQAQAASFSSILESLLNKNSKAIFETQKGAVVLAAVQSSLNAPESDYQNAVDVIFVIEQLLSIYNQFVDELQVLQSPNGTEVDSYLPNADFMYQLNFAVNYTVSNLFQIALTAQQERIIYLENDSNAIVLAHRFYGLEDNDSTIQRFIETNNIQLNELLQLKKGRKIVYYV
jgi:hypothetical protein